MTTWIIIAACLVIAGIGKATMDVVMFHFSDSIFPFYNGWCNFTMLWRNKWKNGDPTQGEAFPGSSTVFVFVTDLWHFAQFIFLRFMFAALVLMALTEPLYAHWSSYIVEYVSASVIFGGMFSLFYNKILK